MSTTRALKRLARIRELEEEQSRLQLEAAARSREEVAEDLLATHQELRGGRQDLMRGVERSDGCERQTGLVRMELAEQRAKVLRPRLEQMNQELARQREEYLARRTARLQVETLLSEAEQRRLQEAERRAQQVLDDWYGRKRRPAASDAARSPRRPA